MNQFTQAKKDGMQFGFFVIAEGWYYYRTLEEALSARPSKRTSVYDMEGRKVTA